MIRKILVANRGEIACRVFRTARRMGIRTVAVWSDADRGALHVRSADEAFRIGPAPASDSYLNVPAILRALASSGADAVHPGYGFLSENPEFAEATAAAGATFVGPSPEAMRAVGDKREARRRMRRAGVPVVPGAEDVDDLASLREAARETGFPLMIKAAAGGGGRGMRRVERPSELEAAYEACRREAQAAFGDDRLLAERCIDAARHVEVQILADSRGETVHLLHRDCSAQRKHQKMLEEAPAPGLDPDLSERICATAVSAARAVGYLGAGTVEFLVPASGDAFYFLEINARLQVEHPVTEAITGMDLVEWQIRIANGEPLPGDAQPVGADGHAIEARFCAEDPDKGFMPAPGRILRLSFPEDRRDLRIDTGVEDGDRIPPEYDSMIAKIVAHGETREAARRRLVEALAATWSWAPATNAEFLLSLAESAEFRDGTVTTDLIERMLAEPSSTGPSPEPEALVAAALEAHRTRSRRRPGGRAKGSGAGFSPFSADDGWRLAGPAELAQKLRTGEEEFEVRFRRDSAAPADVPVWTARIGSDGRAIVARNPAPGLYEVESVDGDASRSVRVETVDDAGTGWVAFRDLRRWRFAPVADSVSETGGRSLGDAFRAPLPGHVLRRHVEEGDRVRAGDKLVTVEAMKTEHAVLAPAAGRVVEFRHAVGDRVSEGETLLTFEFEDAGEATA